MRSDKYEFQSDFARKYIALGREEGVQQGIGEELKRSLATVIGARGMNLDEAARARVDAELDRDRLRRWLARAATARGVEEIFSED